MCQFKNCLIGFALSRSICDAILQLLWSSVVSIPCWLGPLKVKCYILSYIHSLFITLVTCAITIFWDNHQGNRNIDTSDLRHSDKFSQILNVCHNQSIFLTACILTRKTALTIYLFFFLCVGVWVDVYVCAGLWGFCGRWKKVLDLLELASQSFGSPYHGCLEPDFRWCLITAIKE